MCRRGVKVFKREGGLQMPYSDEILGKVFSPYGDTIDGTVVENDVRICITSILKYFITIQSFQREWDFRLCAVRKQSRF